MTQRRKIYDYMLKHGSITQAEAFLELSCTRLSARIWDLKNKDGVRIRKETERGTNKAGEPCHYDRYYLEEI